MEDVVGEGVEVEVEVLVVMEVDEESFKEEDGIMKKKDDVMNGIVLCVGV